MSSHIVGYVAGITRYPVKSMRGEALTSTRVWWSGLEGDRRYAFVRVDNRSRFPWLTGREVSQLLLYRPFFDEPADPVTSPVSVETPAGEVVPIESSSLMQSLEQLAGERLHLLHLGRGTFDSGAVSLITTATLSSLGHLAQKATDARRFRANILVESCEDKPYPEDMWLGGLLAFGTGADSVKIRVIRRIKRCMMINLDPSTAKQDPRVLRAVVEEHNEYAGVYGVPEHVGSIRIGDPIILEQG